MSADSAIRKTALALDIGGTKMAAGLVSADGEVSATVRRPTPPGGTAEELWDVVTGVLDEVSAGVSYDAVGIGCGGPMRWPEGSVSPVNIPGWRDFPLLERVRERYGPELPVAIHNDAVAVALAESRWGAGRGARNVLGMVVSTGVGGGLVVGGERVDGASGNAGHIGHVVVEPDGPACGCGGFGCLEAIARGPAIARDAVARGWHGEQTGVAVAAGARAGDVACVAAYARAGRAVGIAVASVVALLDLDVVSIGGGVAQGGSLLFGPLQEAFDRHAVLAYTRHCRIVPAALGEHVGLAGAAALVL
jgi:glucokinase